MTNQDQDNFTEEEYVDIMKFQGKKLATFLYKSNMPEDIKESWIAILPKMSLEQIERFIEILEAKYLDKKTRDIDDKFKGELESMVKKYQDEDVASEENLLQEIKKISDSI